jgi:hypothetical protein
MSSGSDKSGCTYSGCCGSGGSSYGDDYTQQGTAGTFVIGSRRNERYLYMGHFPVTALKSLKPTSVTTNQDYNADAIYYDVHITGIVHGLNLGEDAITVSFIEDGEHKIYLLGKEEILLPQSVPIEGAKNYGRRTNGKNGGAFVFPTPFSYEMLTTIKLSIKGSGLGLPDEYKQVAECDGAVLTATNGIEVYKLVAYGNETCSFI